MSKLLVRVALFGSLLLGSVYFLNAQCDNPQQIPYNYDFEDCNTGINAFPTADCWTKVIASNNYPYPVSVSYNQCLAFKNVCCAALPELGEPLGSLRINFDMLVKSTDNELLVAVVSSPDELGLWDAVYIDTLTLPATDVFYSVEVHFNDYSGDGRYIILQHAGAALTYVDNVVVSELPNCLNPTNVTASNITAQSATLTWAEMGNATQWNGILSTTPVTNFNNQNPMTLTSTTYNANNLSSNTTYYFYVQSVCNGENSEWSSTVFTTACGVSILPLNEEFTPNTIPDCWEIQQVTGAATFTFPQWNQDMTVFPAAGGAMAQWASGSIVSGRQARLVTQAVSTIGANVLDVNFMWRHSDDNPQAVTEGVQVQYSFDGTNWTDAPQGLITRYNNMYSGWSEYDVMIPAAGEHSCVYVGFLFTAGGGSNCYLDEVHLRAGNGCFIPANFTASNVTGNTAELVWTEVGTANSWDVVVSEFPISNFNGVTFTNVTSPNYQISGLNPTTTYYAYVRSACSGNDVSDWSRGVAFTTGCGTILNLPYSEDFDDYGTGSNAFPTCWARPATSYYQSNVTPSATDISAMNGNQSLILCTGSNMQTYAITPAIGADIHDVAVSFFLYKENVQYSGTVEVGVMSNAGDYATFENVATFDLQQPETWQFCSVSFENTTTTGSNRYIAFRHNGISDFNYYLLDEVTILPAVDCWLAMHLEVNNITGNSADFSWLDVNETPANWHLKISDYPLMNPAMNANVVDTLINATSFSINYLNGGTDYYYYLQSECGENNEGEWITGSFTTLPCNCYMVFSMHDSYGDGWNEAKIQIKQGTTVLAEITLEDGSEGVDTVYTCTADHLDFYYVVSPVGVHCDAEVSFTIENSQAGVIYTSNGTMQAGSFFSNTPACGVNCNAVPANVTATALPGGGAHLSWQSVPSAQSYTVYRNSELIAEYIPTTSFTDLNTIDGENCYTVAATCIVGESSQSNSTCVVGIDEYDSTNDCVLYPNPANDKITLRAVRPFNRLEICNLMGQTVWAENISATETDIALPFNCGIYFLRIFDGNSVIVKKFVIEK